MFLPALFLAPADHEPSSAGCPLCGRDGTAVAHREGSYAYRRCPRCALVFIDPRPRAEVLRERYRVTPLEPPEANAAHMRPMYERALSAFTIGTTRGVAPPRGRRLLDLGCGWGHFVALARERGWDAEGVELSEPAIAYARARYGLALHREAPAGPFDVVTLFFVLEHVPDPVAFLSDARSRLAPGGLLACVTPWTSPLVKWARAAAPRANLYETPWHLADFSPRALCAAMARAGLAVVAMGPAGAPGHLPRAACAALRLLDAAARWTARGSGGRVQAPGLSVMALARIAAPPM